VKSIHYDHHTQHTTKTRGDIVFISSGLDDNKMKSNEKLCLNKNVGGMASFQHFEVEWGEWGSLYRTTRNGEGIKKYLAKKLFFVAFALFFQHWNETTKFFHRKEREREMGK
jgi:hypothetical protein